METTGVEIVFTMEINHHMIIERPTDLIYEPFPPSNLRYGPGLIYLYWHLLCGTTRPAPDMYPTSNLTIFLLKHSVTWTFCWNRYGWPTEEVLNSDYAMSLL